MIENILKKDLKLPECDKKTLGRFILSFLIPNIFFLLTCFFLSATRPIINIDYIFPCLLLAFNNRFVIVVGFLMYVLMIFIEAYIIMIQFFNFLDLAALRDFLPFMFDAPKEYIFLYGLLIIFAIVLPLSARILNDGVQKFYAIVFSIIAFIVYYLFGYMGSFDCKYFFEKNGGDFAVPVYYIYSQTFNTQMVSAGLFERSLFRSAQLIQYPENKERAATNIQQPYNKKIFFIVAESLGSLTDESAQQEMLSKLNEQKENYDFLNIGELSVNNATVQGELRELCNKTTDGGHDTRHLSVEDFSTCLPQLLVKQGHYTVAFHGAGSSIYHRRSLYPKLGFKKTMFNEQMQDKKRCHSFKGTCDSEIFPLVANEFAQHDRILVYWLTLTSHYPYDKRDIFNQRFNCEQFNIEQDNPMCRNIKMQTQFMDLLAQLSTQPEMRGVEVLIVGDHSPPVFEPEAYRIRKFNKVSFIHFKIKE